MEVQKDIIEKKLRFYTINAYDVAEKTGMGSRVNTIMQTCFFAISGILPRDEAIAEIKKAIEKTYGKRGEAVVLKNYAAVDQTLVNLHEVKVPAKVTSTFTRRAPVPAEAPAFVRDVLGPMIAFEGDTVPVSAMPVDGTFPTGTTKWEKRNIALEIPVWESELCIQCGKCVFVCPHAVIRHKVYDKKLLENAPQTFKSMDSKFKEFPGMAYTVQVAPEDCTGCMLCVEACPAKDKTNPARKAINMAPQPALRESEAVNWEFFLSLPEIDRIDHQPRHHQELPTAPAPVRVFWRLRRLWRNTLYQTHVAVVWRPRHHRQRHRLLLDLWRQPAHHSLHVSTRMGMVRPGPTHSLRIMPNSAWASA